MIFNQANYIRQELLVLRFRFNRFEYRQRFQSLLLLCRGDFLFLHCYDGNIQSDGSPFSFFGGDAGDVSAVQFCVSFYQIKPDTRTFLIAGVGGIGKNVGRCKECPAAGFPILCPIHRYPLSRFLRDRKETTGYCRRPE